MRRLPDQVASFPIGMFGFDDKQSEELLTDESPSSLPAPPSSRFGSSSTSSLFFIFISFSLFTFFTLLTHFSPLTYLRFFWKGLLNHRLTFPETTTQRLFGKTTHLIPNNSSPHPTIVPTLDYSVKQSWADSLYKRKAHHKFRMPSILE
jgi:hypothetical protein